MKGDLKDKVEMTDARLLAIEGQEAIIKAEESGDATSEARAKIARIILMAEEYSLFVLSNEDRQYEKFMKERLKYEKVTAECNTILTQSKDLNKCLPEVLDKLRQTVDASRAYVFRNDEDTDMGTCMTQIYESTAEDIEPQIDNPDLQKLPYKEASPRLLSLMQGKSPYVGVVDDFDEPEKTILKEQGIQSILIMPIYCDEKWWGFIGFDDCFEVRDWQKEDVDLLQIGADNIGSTIQRHKSDEKYKRLAENITDVVWVRRLPDMALTYISPSTYTQSGFTPEEKAQMPIDNTMTPESAKKVNKILDEELAREEELGGVENIERSRTFELEMYKKDGSTFMVEMTVSAMRNEEGNIVEIIGVSRDISVRKAVEKALELERAQVLSILKSIDAVIHVTDPKTNEILFVNDNMKKVFGEKELVGGICYKELQGLDEPCEFCTNDRLKPDGEPYEWEHHNPVVNRDYNITDRLVTWPDGRLVRLEVAIDITDRLHAEKEQIKMQKLEAVGVMAGGIAHDFNNLLTGIMGNTSLAIDEDDKKERKQLLAEVMGATRRSTNLTAQLLSFAKGGIVSKEVGSVTEIVKESAYFALGKGAKSRCEINMSDDLWLADMDAGQIGQVIQNLVINANQAMPEGGIINIQAENVELEDNNSLGLAPGSYVCLSVEDSGIGMPKKYLSKIFDPYWTTKSKEGTGSGLGLAVCNTVMQKHSGHIVVQSESGIGTTFTMHIPATKQGPKDILQVAESSEAPEGLNILIMDDEVMIHKIMSRALDKLKYQFKLTHNGEETLVEYAAAMDANDPFDLVILDLTVPGGMGGKETLEKLKEMDPNVLAIVSSGYSDAYPEGFAATLNKPYTFPEIKEKIIAAMKSKKKSSPK
ncbi:MAG TPA: PAS domain-containing protein [Candidatus Cloacimonetes bacterium]|nr:PAS domain-containing protein [Candidatus Cloacimonadota bacterium]